MKRIVPVIVAAVAVFVGFVLVEKTAYLESEPDLSLAEELPLMDCYDMMDIMVDPRYEELKDVAAEEPTGRKGWRGLYIHAYAMGELANLLFSRTDQEYMLTPEWDELTIEMRQLCNNIGEATKAKDYAAVKKNYVALIENCNACHQKFEPDDAPEVKVWDE